MSHKFTDPNLKKVDVVSAVVGIVRFQFNDQAGQMLQSTIDINFPLIISFFGERSICYT